LLSPTACGSQRCGDTTTGSAVVLQDPMLTGSGAAGAAISDSVVPTSSTTCTAPAVRDRTEHQLAGG